MKLEIWGEAQREAVRRRKSNWGTVKGLKFRSQRSHVARTQLHYHQGRRKFPFRKWKIPSFLWKNFRNPFFLQLSTVTPITSAEAVLLDKRSYFMSI